MKSRLFIYIFFIVLLIGFSLNAIYLYCTPHYTPNIEKIDLSRLLEKDIFTPYDYALLFEQTGLSAPIIEELRTYPDFKTRLFSEGQVTLEKKN